MNPRATANTILLSVIHGSRSLDFAFSKHLSSTLSPQERGFIKDVCFGVLRWFHQLSFIKSQLLHSELKKRDSDIDCLILLGLFQLLYTDIANHAAVSETVSVCRLLKKDWASALINKCLRRFIDEKEVIMSSVEKITAAQFSHPKWFIKKIQMAWPEQWETILAANNEKPPLWLRINKQKISREDFIKELKKHEISCSIFDNCLSAIRINTPTPVNKIPLFDTGYVSVQDLAGQFAAALLDLKENQYVLDACAAPGSKTGHILESQTKLSKLIIIDKEASRFSKITENLKRLDLDTSAIEKQVADILDIESWWGGELFDRILLDVPCSATGVIRRHPDIKLLRKKSDLEKLSATQERMLNTLWPLLKVGGKLLYSTCSVLPDENESQIETFLAKNKDAQAESIQLPLGIPQKQGVQLLPKTELTDGFYYALLCKNSCG